MATVLYGVRIYHRGLAIEKLLEIANYFIPDVVKKYGNDWVCSTDYGERKMYGTNYLFILGPEGDEDHLYIATYHEVVYGIEPIPTNFHSSKLFFQKFFDIFPQYKRKPRLYVLSR